MNVYNISSVQNFTTSDLTVLPSQKFFPATSMQLGKLWTETAKSVTDWTEMFQDAPMCVLFVFDGDPVNSWGQKFEDSRCPVLATRIS